MYIETSPPRVEGDNAKLELSVSGNGELSCLEFYYHMYGDTMGTLNVFSGGAIVFNVSGNHGNHWIKAEITIKWNGIVSFNRYTRGSRILKWGVNCCNFWGEFLTVCLWAQNE